MRKSPDVLNILFVIEVIVAARILMFAVPVWLQKGFPSSPENPLSEWFLESFAVPAIFFFLCGLSGLLGHRLWKTLHILVVFLTLIFSASFCHLARQVGGGIPSTAVIPPLAALAVFAMITVGPGRDVKPHS